MTRKQQIARLEALASMIRDHDMARLQRAAAQRDSTQRRIDQLPRGLTPCSDAALFRAAQSHLAWASEQRLHLNATLALETAQLIEQRQKTAKSHGRAEALARLRSRMAEKRR